MGPTDQNPAVHKKQMEHLSKADTSHTWDSSPKHSWRQEDEPEPFSGEAGVGGGNEGHGGGCGGGSGVCVGGRGGARG